RCQYYLHNFLTSQPDLNFHHPEVQEALLDTVKFWLARGVDGYRLDTANFYFHDAQLRDNPARGKPTGEHAVINASNPYG
ncbi:MAG: alpha-amylase family glycosyl hydrolase, partial [Propionivibrio sp.]